MKETELVFELDAESITLDDMEELENAKTFKQIKSWLARKCGVSDAEIGKMNLKQLGEVKAKIRTVAMGDTIPN